MSAAAGSLWDRFKTHAKSEMGLPSIVEELKYAVEDIRQKVVEEATYGRPTTPPIGIHGEPDAPDATKRPATPSFADHCRDVARPTPSWEQDRGNDHGPER